MCVTTGLCAVSSPAKRHYHVVYDLKNMTEAQSYCREKYTDLVTLDNMEDVKILNNMVDLKKMVYPQYSYVSSLFSLGISVTGDKWFESFALTQWWKISR